MISRRRAAQFVANVTGSNPGGDLALVSVDIAPGLTGHTPAALLPPGSGGAGGASPAPAPSGEVRVLVRNPVRRLRRGSRYTGRLSDLSTRFVTHQSGVR